MPSNAKNAALLFLGRTIMRAQALTGDPAARLFAMRPTKDPYSSYEAVRAQGTLVRSKMGMYLTASHELCNSLVRDHRFGVLPPGALSPVDSRAFAADGRVLVNPVEQSFLVRNPPDHTRLRKSVAPWFTPRALRDQVPTVERVVTEYLDEVGDRPTFDLVGEFAARVPIQVIADLLGVPSGDHASFARWGSALVNALDGVRDMGEMRALHSGLREFDAFLGDLVEHRRRHPGTDIVSTLVAKDELSHDELLATTELLLVAGFETTVNLIGNAVLAVLANPAVRRRLVEDPDYAEKVVEETLRTDPPVQYTVRIPLEHVEVAGTKIAKGTPIMLLLAAANRDPAVFADPHRFDPDRPELREHLAFSSGIHYCLGAGLARIEGAAALRGVFGRFPDLRAAGPVRRRPSRIIRGALRLPVSTGVTKRSLAVQ
jgi:cytochrome P450